MKLTKTDYLIYKDCAKNAWIKIHKPDIYFSKPLSAFDEGIIETGNEVDVLARDLFPGGVLIESRNDFLKTDSLLKSKTKIIYQPVFETDTYKIVCDILVWNEKDEVYDLYEVKASNSGENKKAKDDLYTDDIAFQYIVLKKLGVPLGKLNLIRLNNEYIRVADLDIHKLFSIEDFTERVVNIIDDISEDMKNAFEILSTDEEPVGSCKCITRGRSAHCTTFSYSNPEVPNYSVHDISRIGSSKAKLAELVDSGIFAIEDIPDDFPLSEKQKNQVLAAKTNKTIIEQENVNEFLSNIHTPISFLDYETFAAGVPRYTGYSPFNQIPFQFSLHIVSDSDLEPKHSEFIFTENKNPDEAFLSALKTQLPSTGNIIAWHKSFEIGRNNDLAKRNPDYKSFIEDINSRFVDLEEIFINQYFVHPLFKGKTSIKYILPVLVPELSYKTLNIQEGATASNTWDRLVKGEYSEKEKQEKIESLKEYCKLDTYAMYKIWKYLKEKAL